MGWRQHIPFSSPSSSPSPKKTSRPVSPDKNEVTGRVWYHRGFGIRPQRLSRQKKIRYLKDLKSSSDRAPSSSSSSGVSLSPSTAVPLPLPLPLPEGQRESRNPQSGKSSGQGKGVDERSTDTGRDRSGNRDRAADEAGDGVLSSSSFGSVIASGQDAKSQTTHHDQRDGYWVNIPQSAPTSPYGSPTITPHRNSTGDVFLCFNTAPKENHVWSAPEMPLDTSGRLPPAFYDNSALSADNSPINSPQPRSPRSQIKSPGRPSSPLHPMLSPAGSSGAPPRERSSSPLHPRLCIEVHPLPLPPGASPSRSASCPIPVKQELFPMNSQWQKGKLIGRGTFGSVYVASNRETGALCAMKEVEMFPDDPKSAESIKQLEQEIRLLSNLQHPNIVQYYGSEIVGDRFNIYLEYVHPGSIDKYIREHCGAMTESVVRSFTRHILNGLAYLHSMKTVHRDIKGANLLVDASGVVKLADFGMAKHLAGQRADLSLKGSPYWMAPELMQAVMQKDNSSDLAFAVDIWSLGCTIIEMFTGKPPWSGFEGAAAMFKVMKDTPPIPDSLSPEGKDFLKRCFKRNPAERPTAAMLREHLFVKNSQQPSPTSPQPDVSSFSQLFNGMKLTNPNGRREGSSSVLMSDQLQVPPTSGSTRR